MLPNRVQKKELFQKLSTCQEECTEPKVATNNDPDPELTEIISMEATVVSMMKGRF